MTPISQTASVSIAQRLRKSVEVLTLIENCRRATGDPGLGLAIERLIVQRELAELEDADGHEEPTRVLKMEEDVVIPVRRVVDR